MSSYHWRWSSPRLDSTSSASMRARRSTKPQPLPYARRGQRNLSTAGRCFDVIELRSERHGCVRCVGAHVPVLQLPGEALYAEPLSDEILAVADSVVIVTDPIAVDYDWLVQRASLVVEAWRCDKMRP